MTEKEAIKSRDGPQVFGAGLPRTGTNSLQEALKILGFDPCHHFKSDILFDRFPYTKTRQWHKAYDMIDDKEGRQAVLRQIYQEGGYKAAVDYPTSAFVEDLVEMYPEAKFVHGVRSTAEAWRKSFNDTIGKVRDPLIYVSGFLLPSQRMSLQPLLDRFETRNEHVLGTGIYYPKDSVEIYHRHNAHIRQIVPKDRLLEFDPKMGWEPLCEFLGVPVPTDEHGNPIPYPHVNDTSEIQRGMKIGLAVGWSTWAALFGAGYVTAKYLWLPLWRGS